MRIVVLVLILGTSAGVAVSSLIQAVGGHSATAYLVPAVCVYILISAAIVVLLVRRLGLPDGSIVRPSMTFQVSMSAGIAYERVSHSIGQFPGAKVTRENPVQREIVFRTEWSPRSLGKS